MANNKFNIGTKVSVLDDNISGVITSIEKFVISIEDEDGFIRHFKPSELVVIETANLYEAIDEKEIHRAKGKNNSVLTEKSKTNKKNTFLEVDLHIHHLTHSNKYMSNFEMLSRQLEVAKQKIEYAIKMKINRVIFIHGKGQGKLKTELHQLLNNYPIEINDANYQQYGKGATEVKIFVSKV